MTMKQAAKEISYDMGLFTSVAYTNWDADMIQVSLLLVEENKQKLTPPPFLPGLRLSLRLDWARLLGARVLLGP